MADGSEILTVPDQTSKVSTLSASEDSIELTTRAYSKIILHAAKYPHATVNGVLLAKYGRGQKSGPRITFIDAIPLFHQIEGLTPMIEVALSQIESRATSASMCIAGFYHASRNFRDSNVDVFSQRIADRIADWSPLNRAALLTVDNRKLSVNLQSHALLGQMYIVNNADNGGRWRTIAAKSIKVDELTYAVTSSLLQNRSYKDIVDFDNHLDDVAQDYLNVGLNMEIDRAASS